ncbi:biotin/lipoyl-containing protein [Algisphaera agarilytica]|uniref:Biotin carboxyl carrier protein n=1 Tax=Algisphaera agarilytica TaxID=1385975 RepID=A0A7X0LKE2_9BACT|nr:biotin/lipoyl-containing protein [Algisphaera agarilytica]MBB6429749.1 biotin carboxyl carrier protein [Algisphaera agarilytica]
MKMLITVDGQAYHVEVQILEEEKATVITDLPVASSITLLPPSSQREDTVESPLTGNVLEVLVKPGDTVAANETLVVIEAMKMESSVVSPHAGIVKEVHVSVGDTATVNQVLVTF